MLEFVFLVFALLLFVICFLLYQIYKIKYRRRSELNSTFIPQVDIEGETGWELRINSRLEEIDTKISELERKLKKQERSVKKLAEALSVNEGDSYG